jgi:tetratricopeptide (TPR) repeat protein
MGSETIKGVYYETKKIEAGTMGTRRTHEAAHDLHYYAKSNATGAVDLFYLKPDNTPTAMIAETIGMDAFTARFKDCANHQCDLKPKSETDKKKEASLKKTAIGKLHLDKQEFHAAAFEFGQAIKVDGENLDAHLGKGKAHIGLGEVDKARETFAKMSEIDSLYDKENKHLFNEYGIELRKGQMYDMAIDNYQKAIEIDADDEALYFNLARACQESGQLDSAAEHLKKALSLKPDFNEAKLLLNALTKASAK